MHFFVLIQIRQDEIPQVTDTRFDLPDTGHYQFTSEEDNPPNKEQRDDTLHLYRFQT